MIKNFESFIFYSNDFDDFLHKEIIAHLVKKFHINEKKAKELIKRVFSDKEIKNEIYNLDLVNRAKNNQELIPNAGRKIVEQFFIYFQQNINERMIVLEDDFMEELENILDRCREKIININIPSKVFNALKKELKEFSYIDIIFTKSDRKNLYNELVSPKIFVDYYAVTSNGAVIFYVDGFIDLLSEIIKDDDEQDNFKFEIITSISHEMIHFEQYYRAWDKKIDFDISNTKNYNTEKEYLGNKHELMSFTQEIYYELSKKHRLTNNEIIHLIKNISSLDDDKLYNYSKQLHKYYNIFHGTKIQSRFIIYITDIIRIKEEQTQ